MFAATATCWLIGALGARHTRVWGCRATPQRSWFVHLDRQHLIVSDQEMIPRLLPSGYAMDTTQFRSYTLSGPDLAAGGTTLDLGFLNPTRAWFREFSIGIGNITMLDTQGKRVLLVSNFYHALEI